MSHDALLAFASEVMEWADEGLARYELQDIAVKHGLLRAEIRTEPCGDNCRCAEYHGTDEFEDGVVCYQKPEWLK